MFKILKSENWYDLYDYITVKSNGNELLTEQPFKYKALSPNRNIDNISEENLLKLKSQYLHEKKPLKKEIVENNKKNQKDVLIESLNYFNEIEGATNPTDANRIINTSVMPDPCVDLSFINSLNSENDNAIF